MEALVDAKLVHSIGISNVNNQKLVDILTYARIPPAMNQVELHPYNDQPNLVEFQQGEGVALTAYSPFGSGRTGVLDDKVVADIATKHHKSNAQVLIRYQIQRGIAVVPKSVNPDRIADNFKVWDFTLSEEDMARLAALDQQLRALQTKFFFKMNIYAYLEVTIKRYGGR